MSRIFLSRFTGTARDVIDQAQKEAANLFHEYIGVEHILLAMLTVGGTGTRYLWHQRKIDFAVIKNELESLAETGIEVQIHGRLPMTPRAKQAIELANDLSLQARLNFVSTYHLLLGLLGVDGAASSALKNVGVTCDNSFDLIRLNDVSEFVSDNVGVDAPDRRSPVEEWYRSRTRIEEKLPDDFDSLCKLIEAIDVTGTPQQIMDAARKYSEAIRMSEKLDGSESHTLNEKIASKIKSVQRPKVSFVSYEQFTDRARKVMQLANEEALRLNHECLGTEHILLGLVREGTGVAANVLSTFEIDFEKIRLEVEKLMQRGPDGVTIGKLPKTPRAKKVVEFAIEAAEEMGDKRVGTEHILLGLLRVKEGVASVVLTNFGLNPERVREEILNLLGLGQAIIAQSTGKEKTPREGAIDELKFLREQVSRHYQDMLAVLSTVIPTPAEGYEAGGGFSRVLADVKNLARSVQRPLFLPPSLYACDGESQRREVQKLCNHKGLDFFALDALCNSTINAKGLGWIEMVLPASEIKNDVVGVLVTLHPIKSDAESKKAG